MNNLLDTIWQQVQDLNTRVDLLSRTMTTFSAQSEITEDVSGSILELQNKISSLTAQITALQANLSGLNNSSNTITTNFEQVNLSIDQLREDLGNIDNELYFIIKGSYLTLEQIENIMNGNY